MGSRMLSFGWFNTVANLVRAGCPPLTSDLQAPKNQITTPLLHSEILATAKLEFSHSPTAQLRFNWMVYTSSNNWPESEQLRNTHKNGESELINCDFREASICTGNWSFTVLWITYLRLLIYASISPTLSLNPCILLCFQWRVSMAIFCLRRQASIFASQ